jgi:hypothetical protein
MIEDKDYLKNLPTASIDDEDDEDTNKYASSKKTDVKSKTHLIHTVVTLTKMAEEGRIDQL